MAVQPACNCHSDFGRGRSFLAWLPKTFVAPNWIEVDAVGLHLRPIHPDDTEIDMVAVMGSRDRLWSIYGQAWGWTPADMTADAEISLWVVDQHVDGQVEQALDEFGLD